jgi:hypothetical protein
MGAIPPGMAAEPFPSSLATDPEDVGDLGPSHAVLTGQFDLQRQQPLGRRRDFARGRNPIVECESRCPAPFDCARGDTVFMGEVGQRDAEAG